MISVKGGANLNPGMVRDLIGAVQAQRAELGVLVTLEAPTRGMIEAVQHSGAWQWQATGQQFPLVQIITVQDLLAGLQPTLPPLYRPYVQGRRLIQPLVQPDLPGTG